MGLNQVTGPSNSPVDEALSRLHGRVENINNYLDNLVSRLEGVLSPSAPKAEARADSTAIPSSAVPHARTLHNIANALDTQIERVRDLLERLAL